MLAGTFLASVVQPGFGALTDKYRNLGWLVAAGLLIAGLGIGLSGLGDSYLITWVAVADSGVGVAAYHPEATRVARVLAGDSTQAMSWFTVGGNAGIALGPVIVTPVLLATRLDGTPLLAIPAVVMGAVLVWDRVSPSNPVLRQVMRSLTWAGHVMELFPAIPRNPPGHPGKLLPFRMPS